MFSIKTALIGLSLLFTYCSAFSFQKERETGPTRNNECRQIYSEEFKSFTKRIKLYSERYITRYHSTEMSEALGHQIDFLFHTLEYANAIHHRYSSRYSLGHTYDSMKSSYAEFLAPINTLKDNYAIHIRDKAEQCREEEIIVASLQNADDEDAFCRSVFLKHARLLERINKGFEKFTKETLSVIDNFDRYGYNLNSILIYNQRSGDRSVVLAETLAAHQTKFEDNKNLDNLRRCKSELLPVETQSEDFPIFN